MSCPTLLNLSSIKVNFKSIKKQIGERHLADLHKNVKNFVELSQKETIIKLFENRRWGTHMKQL